MSISDITQNEIFLILFLFAIKHFYVDFINQDQEEVDHKGIYGNWLGFKHSLKHGYFTVVILASFIQPLYVFLLAGLDVFIHYHTDYIKMRFGCRDITQKTFWVQLGLDQLVHSLTYLLIVVIIQTF